MCRHKNQVDDKDVPDRIDSFFPMHGPSGAIFRTEKSMAGAWLFASIYVFWSLLHRAHQSCADTDCTVWTGFCERCCFFHIPCITCSRGLHSDCGYDVHREWLLDSDGWNYLLLVHIAVLPGIHDLPDFNVLSHYYLGDVFPYRTSNNLTAKRSAI